MAKKSLTLQHFEAAKLTRGQASRTKGGYKEVPGLPGGTGSVGLIDWGEIEIRLVGMSAFDSKDTFLLRFFG